MKKNIELKRLLIYLGLSFGMTWIWFLIANPKFTLWTEMPQSMQSFIALGMMFPVISHVLTRLITKEGFKLSGKDSMLLGISFKDKKWIFYLLAMLLPWIYTEIGSLMEMLFCKGLFDPGYPAQMEIDAKLIPIIPVSAIVSGTVFSFAAFGEEGGWRGYMMPKLLKLFEGKKAGKIWALLIGGVIWGLWHAPLTCIGHNFGTDYPGFPVLGIVIMCVYCTLLGIVLTFLTEMSGSVWPAAILHAVNNSGPSILSVFLNYEKADSPLGDFVPSMLGGLIPLLILSGICLVIRKCKMN